MTATNTEPHAAPSVATRSSSTPDVETLVTRTPAGALPTKPSPGLGGLGELSKAVKGFLGREPAKFVLARMLSWPRSQTLTPGYSIILGTPWHLRHLLEANLLFLNRLDRTNLRAIHVVLDRPNQSALEEVRRSVADRFGHLPLVFQCYQGASGRLVEALDICNFYNCMNCATALSAIDSTHAVLHDFDLYPLRPDYFERMYRQMVDRSLHYCGVERTKFDGLTEEDHVLGTWGLGMDVGWLRRQHEPIEIFHVLRRIHGRWTSLDPFSDSQLRFGTRRELVDDVTPEDFCHVTNLCSNYLRFSTGRPAKFAWRLHYLWYLESIIGKRRLDEVSELMRRTQGSVIELDGKRVDFAGTDATCANVLGTELDRMERSLHGACRPEVRDYVDDFRTFLKRMPRR